MISTTLSPKEPKESGYCHIHDGINEVDGGHQKNKDDPNALAEGGDLIMAEHGERYGKRKAEASDDEDPLNAGPDEQRYGERKTSDDEQLGRHF